MMKASAEKNKDTPALKTTDYEAPPGQTLGFKDNRPEAIQLQEIKNMMHGSPRTTAQRQTISAAVGSDSFNPKPNNTGLPDALKTGLESLSGMDLSDVTVHHNSSRPAQLKALAYAQGNDIYLGPGHGMHLPHEAWHVVQQKQGRVEPTLQLKGTQINDSDELEKEASAMGEKALHLVSSPASVHAFQGGKNCPGIVHQDEVVQRQKKIGFELEDGDWMSWKKTWGIRAPYWKSPTDKRNCRPMKKKELIHAGTDFKLEADELVDTYLVSDIEFVTDPLPLNDDGYKRLQAVMISIDNIYKRITPYQDRDHEKGEFIKNNKSNFSNKSAMLSRGKQHPRLKVQATQGVGLSDIPVLFNALSNEPEKSRNKKVNKRNKKIHKDLRLAMLGDQRPSPKELAAYEPLQSASDRAKLLSMAYLEAKLNLQIQALKKKELNDLHGFLTAAIGFIRMLRNPKAILGGAKTFLPMMHRNDFATLFALLSDRVKKLLRENKSAFIDAIIFGVLGDPGAVKPLKGYKAKSHKNENIVENFLLDHGDVDRFLEPTDGVIKENNPYALPNFENKKPISYYVIPPSFTIRRWVNAWIDGEKPRDILTKAYAEEAAANDIDDDPELDKGMKRLKKKLEKNNPDVVRLIDWSRSVNEENAFHLAFDYKALSKKQQEILLDQLRGLGGLGNETDKDDNSLVLYENRSIAPKLKNNVGKDGSKLDMASATSTVLTYFSALMRLFK